MLRSACIRRFSLALALVVLGATFEQPAFAQTIAPATAAPDAILPGPSAAPTAPAANVAITLGGLLRANRLPPPPLSQAELGESLDGYAFARDRSAITLGYASTANVPHVGVVRYDLVDKQLRYVSVSEGSATIVPFRHAKKPSQQCVSPVDGAVTYGPAEFVLTQQAPDAGCVFAFTRTLVPVAIFSGFPIAFAAGRYVLVRESQRVGGSSEPQLALSVYDARTNAETSLYPVRGDAHVRGYDLDGTAVAAPNGAAFAVTADPNGSRQLLARRPSVDYLFVMSGGRWRSRAMQSDRLPAAYGVSTLEALMRLPLSKLAAHLDPP